MVEQLRRLSAEDAPGLIRPFTARELADQAGDAALPALAEYVRAVPQAEALEFAEDWAVDAWEAFCAKPEPGTGDLTAAMTLAGLAIAHALDLSFGPPIDKVGYNVAAEAARDLYLRLARSAPRAPAPPSLLSSLLASAQAKAADLGFRADTAARIPLLVRICKDFGRSLPRTNPGLRYLA
ncbi:MAG TPA: hypothetical protein VNM16_06795 [Bacillota bacterium]|nr:hypothetical protein [Bacillota bacterium]